MATVCCFLYIFSVACNAIFGMPTTSKVSTAAPSTSTEITKEVIITTEAFVHDEKYLEQNGPRLSNMHWFDLPELVVKLANRPDVNNVNDIGSVSPNSLSLNDCRGQGNCSDSFEIYSGTKYTPINQTFDITTSARKHFTLPNVALKNYTDCGCQESKEFMAWVWNQPTNKLS